MMTVRSRFFCSKSGSAVMPSRSGISMSRRTMSASFLSNQAIVSRPLGNEATTRISGSASIQRANRLRTTTASSTTTTRIVLSPACIAPAARLAPTCPVTRTLLMLQILSPHESYQRAPSPRMRLDQPDFLKLGFDNVLVERLHDVFVGAGMERAGDVGDIVFRGAEHHFRLVAAGQPAQHPKEVIAVHLRHVPIEQDRVRQLVLAV